MQRKQEEKFRKKRQVHFFFRTTHQSIYFFICRLESCNCSFVFILQNNFFHFSFRHYKLHENCESFCSSPYIQRNESEIEMFLFAFFISMKFTVKATKKKTKLYIEIYDIDSFVQSQIRQ